MISCTNEDAPKKIIPSVIQSQEQNEKAFIAILEKHLAAVSARDLKTLASTLSPDSLMILILPNQKVLKSSGEFLNFHREWFQDTIWTFETEIKDFYVGEEYGLAIVESMYKEPNRNGKPYFNNMSISYGLKKVDKKWVVFKDHASSIEKTK